MEHEVLNCSRNSNGMAPATLVLTFLSLGSLPPNRLEAGPYPPPTARLKGGRGEAPARGASAAAHRAGRPRMCARRALAGLCCARRAPHGAHTHSPRTTHAKAGLHRRHPRGELRNGGDAAASAPGRLGAPMCRPPQSPQRTAHSCFPRKRRRRRRQAPQPRCPTTRARARRRGATSGQPDAGRSPPVPRRRRRPPPRPPPRQKRGLAASTRRQAGCPRRPRSASGSRGRGVGAARGARQRRRPPGSVTSPNAPTAQAVGVSGE